MQAFIIITRPVKSKTFVSISHAAVKLSRVKPPVKATKGSFAKWSGTRGGGGYFHMYAYWVYVPRERPPFSALNFRSGAYHFHKLPKNPFRSIIILHFWADFAVPETIIFKISLISTRSSPPTDRELVPEPLPIFHFAAAHAYQNLGWVPPPPPPIAPRVERVYNFFVSWANYTFLRHVHVDARRSHAIKACTCRVDPIAYTT